MEESGCLCLALGPSVVAALGADCLLTLCAYACSFVQAWAGPNVRMVRVMPNTACIVGATASAMSAGPKATAADACLVRSSRGRRHHP